MTLTKWSFSDSRLSRLSIDHCLQIDLSTMTWAITVLQDVGLWLEEINLGSYRQAFEENGVNGEYLESLSMFTTEQILRFIRRCHMKWGDFITLCKELRRIKGSNFCCFYSCASGRVYLQSYTYFYYMFPITVPDFFSIFHLSLHSF